MFCGVLRCAHSAPASLLRPAALMPRRQHADVTYPYPTALVAWPSAPSMMGAARTKTTMVPMRTGTAAAASAA